MTPMPRLCSFGIAFPILLILAFSSCSAPNIGTPSQVPDTSEAIVKAQDIQFTGKVAFQTIDANLDGYYEALAAEVEVEIVTAGGGRIHGGPGEREEGHTKR